MKWEYFSNGTAHAISRSLSLLLSHTLWGGSRRGFKSRLLGVSEYTSECHLSYAPVIARTKVRWRWEISANHLDLNT